MADITLGVGTSVDSPIRSRVRSPLRTNDSCRILPWRVADSLQPAVTVDLLSEAANGMGTANPQVLVDGGVENYNSDVDEVIESGLLTRVLAQTEIRFSNSLIESWWRGLEHQWHYLNELDSAETVEKLVKFYVERYNTHFPHAAFEGQTPDEMYFGTGDAVPKQLERSRIAARKSRLEANRSRSCQACEEVVAISS